MKCSVCGEEIKGLNKSERITTVNRQDGRTTLSTVVNAVCEKCTRTKGRLRIEKVVPNKES